MQNLINYIKCSNLIIEFFLNPFSWKFYIYSNSNTGMDPGLLVNFVLNIGLIKIHLIIDDGSW